MDKFDIFLKKIIKSILNDIKKAREKEPTPPLICENKKEVT